MLTPARHCRAFVHAARTIIKSEMYKFISRGSSSHVTSGWRVRSYGIRYLARAACEHRVTIYRSHVHLLADSCAHNRHPFLLYSSKFSKMVQILLAHLMIFLDVHIAHIRADPGFLEGELIY